MASSLLVLPFSFSLANHRGHWRSGAPVLSRSHHSCADALFCLRCDGVRRVLSLIQLLMPHRVSHFLWPWFTSFVDAVAQVCLLGCADSCVVVIVVIYDLWPSWPANLGYISQLASGERPESPWVRAALTATATVTECCIAVKIYTKFCEPSFDLRHALAPLFQ
jgi:hypothetical protein